MDNNERRLSDGQMVMTGLFVAAPMMAFTVWWMVATLPLALMTEATKGLRGKDRD